MATIFSHVALLFPKNYNSQHFRKLLVLGQVKQLLAFQEVTWSLGGYWLMSWFYRS